MSVPPEVRVRGRSALGLEGGVDDSPITGETCRLDEFVVPLHGELLACFVDERFDEGVEVARIKARRAGRQTTWHVEMPDDLHAVVVRDLARLGALAITAALDREIDD